MQGETKTETSDEMVDNKLNLSQITQNTPLFWTQKGNKSNTKALKY
jgi:hypothetical protein